MRVVPSWQCGAMLSLKSRACKYAIRNDASLVAEGSALCSAADVY